LAIQPGETEGNDPSASGRGRLHPLWAARRRQVWRGRPSAGIENARQAPWKRREYGSRWKPTAGFHRLPHSLGNLAKGARFPLSHRADHGFCPLKETSQNPKPRRRRP